MNISREQFLEEQAASRKRRAERQREQDGQPTLRSPYAPGLHYALPRAPMGNGCFLVSVKRGMRGMF